MKYSKRWVCEEQTLIPELIVFGYDDIKAALPLEEHLHPGSFEFVYIEKGLASWEVEGRAFETKSGDVFMTFPDEVHKGNYDIIEPCRFWWLIVGVPKLDSLNASSGDGSHATGWLRLKPGEESALLEALRALPRVIAVGSTAAVPLRRLMCALQRQGELDGLEACMALLDFLLLIVQRREDANYVQAALKRVANLAALLETRMELSPAVPELAKEAGIGTTHFYRMFQEVTGLTPKAYIEHLRMEEACRRLQQNDDSITQISMDLGFATSQHFATVFRRIKGRTPSEWRRHSEQFGSYNK